MQPRSARVSVDLRPRQRVRAPDAPEAQEPAAGAREGGGDKTAHKPWIASASSRSRSAPQRSAPTASASSRRRRASAGSAPALKSKRTFSDDRHGKQRVPRVMMDAAGAGCSRVMDAAAGIPWRAGGGDPGGAARRARRRGAGTRRPPPRAAAKGVAARTTPRTRVGSRGRTAHKGAAPRSAARAPHGAVRLLVRGQSVSCAARTFWLDADAAGSETLPSYPLNTCAQRHGGRSAEVDRNRPLRASRRGRGREAPRLAFEVAKEKQQAAQRHVARRGARGARTGAALRRRPERRDLAPRARLHGRGRDAACPLSTGEWTRRVRLVWGKGRGVSDWYGGRDAASPDSTREGEGTAHAQSVSGSGAPPRLRGRSALVRPAVDLEARKREAKRTRACLGVRGYYRARLGSLTSSSMCSSASSVCIGPPKDERRRARTQKRAASTTAHSCAVSAAHAAPLPSGACRPSAFAAPSAAIAMRGSSAGKSKKLRCGAAPVGQVTGGWIGGTHVCPIGKGAQIIARVERG